MRENKGDKIMTIKSEDMIEIQNKYNNIKYHLKEYIKHIDIRYSKIKVLGYDIRPCETNTSINMITIYFTNNGECEQLTTTLRWVLDVINNVM